jgi:hypothetical protein
LSNFFLEKIQNLEVLSDKHLTISQYLYLLLFFTKSNQKFHKKSNFNALNFTSNRLQKHPIIATFFVPDSEFELSFYLLVLLKNSFFKTNVKSFFLNNYFFCDYNYYYKLDYFYISLKNKNILVTNETLFIFFNYIVLQKYKNTKYKYLDIKKFTDFYKLSNFCYIGNIKTLKSKIDYDLNKLTKKIHEKIIKMKKNYTVFYKEKEFSLLNKVTFNKVLNKFEKNYNIKIDSY